MKNANVKHMLSIHIAIEGHIARVSEALSSVKLALKLLTYCTVKLWNRDFATSGSTCQLADCCFQA